MKTIHSSSHNKDFFKISVVIPTYNREQFILRAIQTALHQTLPAFEIIVVDDASTDGTETLIEKLKEPRIVYIKNKKNIGAADSRNVGIERVRGDYVAFLDSDDEWTSDKLEKQVYRLQGFDLREHWLCYTQVRVVTDDSSFIKPSRDIHHGEHLSEYLFVSKQFILTSSMLFPYQTIEALRFRSHLCLFQDADVCLRAQNLHTKYCMVKEPLCTWNCQSRSDRITPHHDGCTRLKWFLDSKSLFTKKAKLAFLHHFVFSRMRTREQRDEINNLLLEMIQDQTIQRDEILDIIRNYNEHS